MMGKMMGGMLVLGGLLLFAGGCAREVKDEPPKPYEGPPLKPMLPGQKPDQNKQPAPDTKKPEPGVGS